MQTSTGKSLRETSIEQVKKNTSCHSVPTMRSTKRKTSPGQCRLEQRPASRQHHQLIVLIGALVVCISTFCALLRPVECIELHRRVKRALYDLPDGAELIIGPNLRTTFTCDGLGYGYYADPDNDCKIFHVCQSFKMSDGSIYNNHWSFMCGNQTVFNQVSLACSHPEDSIPCDSARDFYHVNDYFGDVRAPSVRDSDLLEAQDLVSRAYGSRLSSTSTSSSSSSSSSMSQANH